MKSNRTKLKHLSLFAAVIGFTVFLSSCSKDDDIETGKSVSVKVVNSAEASGSQDFYIEGAKVTTVSEGSASENYIVSTNSGNDRKVEFKMAGSSEVYASEKVDLKDDKSYTVILSGTGNSAKITTTEDDLTAPASGKARVRFVHLSTAASGNVDLGVVAGAKLVSNVKYGDVTNFFDVDAGVKLLNVYTTANPSSSMDLQMSNLADGGIYTIILRGSTNVSAQVVRNK